MGLCLVLESRFTHLPFFVFWSLFSPLPALSSFPVPGTEGQAGGDTQEKKRKEKVRPVRVEILGSPASGSIFDHMSVHGKLKSGPGQEASMASKRNAKMQKHLTRVPVARCPLDPGGAKQLMGLPLLSNRRYMNMGRMRKIARRERKRDN